MGKKRKYENLEIELEGKKYYGQRVIEGTNKLDQYIIYENKCITDLKGYAPSKINSEMEAYAKIILAELATGRTLSAQPKSKFNL